MMKHLYYIAALAATFLTAMPLHAQEEAENDATQQQQTRRRSPQASRGERNDKKDTGLPELTVRAQDMNERLTQEIGNARWMRIIYRQVDLMKEQNAPLYYPTRPMNGQMNLFSVIFQLLGESIGMVVSPISPVEVRIGQIANILTSKAELFWSKYHASFT